MAELVDLTDVLGEGGCVTLVRRGLVEVLSVMGVRVWREIGWGEVADRVRQLPRAERGAPSPVLLGKPLPGGWTLVVEVDGRAGWIGARSHTLERLSERGTVAASLWRSPNREEVLYAEDGVVWGGFDLTTGQRWGTYSDNFDAVAAALGFPLSEGGEQSERLMSPGVGQRCTRALEVLTSVRLTRAMFDGPWQGGLRRP
ncbi:DUF6461 domain-containing protein [Streptomyces sp. NPDC046939]|uniref:DUF6461 domain-containing protein n=1 Tax=Streptomyces sp. NPDC046939 TaxID=3155376 RepID=UPI00340B4740